MVSEAELRQTDVGLVPASAGWIVMNARDARWFEKPGQGFSLPLTGDDEYEADAEGIKSECYRYAARSGPYAVAYADAAKVLAARTEAGS